PRVIIITYGPGRILAGQSGRDHPSGSRQHGPIPKIAGDFLPVYGIIDGLPYFPVPYRMMRILHDLAPQQKTQTIPIEIGTHLQLYLGFQSGLYLAVPGENQILERRIQVVHKIQSSLKKLKEFRGLAAHKMYLNRIQIGKPSSLAVELPIPGVTV